MPAHMDTHITPILTYTLVHWHVLPSKSTRAYHTHNDMIHNRTLVLSSVDIHTRISRAPSHEMHSHTGTHSRRRAHAVATCKAQRRTSTIKKKSYSQASNWRDATPMPLPQWRTGAGSEGGRALCRGAPASERLCASAPPGLPQPPPPGGRQHIDSKKKIIFAGVKLA